MTAIPSALEIPLGDVVKAWREYRGWSVPEVLLSGHHANIEQWRAAQSAERTARWRPDLIDDDHM